jgi:DNA-directed RNA polymerase specialized sigma24 family protein
VCCRELSRHRTLREIEGLSTKEVAAIAGISEANVKTRLHRARALLRQQLGDV